MINWKFIFNSINSTALIKRKAQANLKNYEENVDKSQQNKIELNILLNVLII